MTYQVLARKWRPQDFSSIVGQEPITTALRNGLKENRIAQAYLFSGIRGVGKTTAARVLAKALNCERGAKPDRPAENPCNECSPCTEITGGKDLDFLEVDAATYSKVEQVRELTESLRYGPARDRYKVVVLDEVHRLSRQAFDALLKIVEEPPPHLVFVFATTEIDAVPATILSRCQEFQFRRVPSPVLAKHLRAISDAESITVSDAALRLIARSGEGSVRDSVALLDQLATFGNGEIDDHDASNLLGGLDVAIFHRVLAAILEGRPEDVITTIREIESHGWDPHNVFGQFLGYARDALHLAIGGKPESIDLPLEEAEQLADLVRSQSYENLLRLTDHLLTSEPIVRRSEFALLALELAWLRAAELPKLTRVEDLLSGQGPTDPSNEPGPRRPARSAQSTTTPSARPTTKPPSAKPPARPKAKPPTRPTAEPPDQNANEETSASKTPEIDSAGTSDAISDADQDRVDAPSESSMSHGNRLTRFRDALNTRRQPLAALIESAELSFEDGVLKIQPQAGDALLTGALKRENNISLIEELLREIWGRGSTWAAVDAAAAKPTVASKKESPESKKEAVKEATQDPTVQAVLDIFGGNIKNVRRHGSRESNP